MSVQFDSSRNRWVVRWYDAERQRTQRFAEETAARAFDERQRGVKAAARAARSAELAGVSSSGSSRASRSLSGNCRPTPTPAVRARTRRAKACADA
jgi:hypothetical protein